MMVFDNGIRRRNDPVRSCIAFCYILGPLMLWMSIEDFTSAGSDERSDTIDQLKPVVDAWEADKQWGLDAAFGTYSFAVNGHSPVELTEVNTGDPVPNLTPTYGSKLDSVRRSDWVAVRLTTPEECGPSTVPCQDEPERPPPPPPAPPGDLTYVLTQRSGNDSPYTSPFLPTTTTVTLPAMQACTPLEYDAATGQVRFYLQLTRVTAVVDPTKLLSDQTIGGFSNCSQAYGIGPNGAFTPRWDAQTQWRWDGSGTSLTGMPCSWTDFGSYKKLTDTTYEDCMATSNPVLTVRSIDDPFIKAATLTYYTLDFGKSAVSSASSGMFFLIAGLCWTTTTWGLTYQHYKKTNSCPLLLRQPYQRNHMMQQQMQQQQQQQQQQVQQVQAASTAANPLAGGGAAMPVAMPMAVAIPVDDGGIYSQQPQQQFQQTK
jgi:hypothetical protein